MAEDWGKWQKEWDKLEPKARKYSLAGGEKLLNILNARDKALEKHEKDFRAAIKAAVAAGAQGSDYKAFEGKTGVAAAKKLLDEDCRMVVNEINELTLYCRECDTLAKPIDKLTDAMAKHIKSTKEKTPEREKAKKLFAEIQAKLKDLHEASTLHFKVDKFLSMFQKQYNDWIKHLITTEVKGGKEAAEKAASKEAAVAGIDAKSLKAAAAIAEKLRLAFDKPLTLAFELMEGDVKKASEQVKKAQTELAKLKKYAAEVAALYKKNKKAIDAAKDAKDRLQAIEDVAEMDEQAAADFKSVTEALKDAMKKR